VALPVLAGPAWPHPLSDQGATDDARRHERLLWQVGMLRREARSEKLRRPAPSRHASRAHMPRRVFLGLALGWALVTVGLLAAILAIRWFG
jgi:hypothetical protein